jgi:hypothetical protein
MICDDDDADKGDGNNDGDDDDDDNDDNDDNDGDDDYERPRLHVIPRFGYLDTFFHWADIGVCLVYWL